MQAALDESQAPLVGSVIGPVDVVISYVPLLTDRGGVTAIETSALSSVAHLTRNGDSADSMMFGGGAKILWYEMYTFALSTKSPHNHT